MTISPSTDLPEGRMLEAALDYARRGFPVFPLHSPAQTETGCDCRKPKCDSPGKHPRTQNGFHDAATDEVTVSRWWKTWPHANIGLAVPEGYVVVDVDDEEGMRAILDAGRQLPPTAIQQTGRGTHYVYRTGIRIPPKAKLLPKVDLRGPGSYIVAAPSLHANGNRYEWTFPLDEIEIAPPWIADLANKTASQEFGSAPVDVASVLSGVPEGRRDVEIFRTACKLRRLNLPIDVAIGLIWQAADAAIPPFPRDVAERKVQDAYGKYPAGTDPDKIAREVTLLGKDSVLVEFDGSARFVFQDIERYSSKEMNVALEVMSLRPGAPTVPHIQRLNVMSASARNETRLLLDQMFGKEDKWALLLSQAVSMAEQTYLKIDRSYDVSQMEAPTVLRYVIDQLIADDALTILFGAGSSTKTYWLLYMAICIQLGLPFLQWQTERRNVLYIDGETKKGTFAYRVRRVLEGIGLAMPDIKGLRYWYTDGMPLDDQIDGLKNCIEQYQIGIAMVDHLAAVCGGDPSEISSVQRFERMMGKLNIPIVALAHIAGEMTAKPDQVRRPFGSVGWENTARSTIFIRRNQEQGSGFAEVGFFPKKTNDGTRMQDFAASITFTDPGGPVLFRGMSINDASPVLQEARETYVRAWNMLSSPLKPDEFAKAMGMSMAELERLLVRFPDRFFKRIGGGRNNPTVWLRKGTSPEESDPTYVQPDMPDMDEPEDVTGSAEVFLPF